MNRQNVCQGTFSNSRTQEVEENVLPRSRSGEVETVEEMRGTEGLLLGKSTSRGTYF